MLKITGLKKRYKKHQVLMGLDMALERGDVYGFLGTNGCGKTTTMNIICNILAKDEGDISFDGQKIKIGYLPESPTLYGYMRGHEYLDYIGACCDFLGDIRARTYEVLSITGMLPWAGNLIRGYSRGMNQRIGIAAAIYNSPDLLILDEPTSALDPSGRAEVMQTISNLASTGSTIILCTHILTDVERVANKIGILKNGVMAVEGSMLDVKKNFSQDCVINVCLQSYTSEYVDMLTNLELLSKSEVSDLSGITLYAKEGVSESELYTKVTELLSRNNVIPEKIEFKRTTLEQIYLDVTGGLHTPDVYTPDGGGNNE